MTGHPLSDQLRLMLPGLATLLLMLLCALPMALMDIALTPHVAWLMTLSVAAIYPPAWPVTLAFVIGLVSDFVYGTPLGSQALLTLFLTLFLQAQARRTSHQLFHLRWFEAALALAVLHGLLCGFVLPTRPPIAQVALGALVNAFWFPIFFLGAQALLSLLPARN